MLALDKDESTWPNEGSAWPAQGGQAVGMLHANTHSHIPQHAYPPYIASNGVSAGKAAGVAGVEGVASGDVGGALNLAAGTQFTCCTSTLVQILTPASAPAAAGVSATSAMSTGGDAYAQLGDAYAATKEHMQMNSQLGDAYAQLAHCGVGEHPLYAVGENPLYGVGEHAMYGAVGEARVDSFFALGGAGTHFTFFAIRTKEQIVTPEELQGQGKRRICGTPRICARRGRFTETTCMPQVSSLSNAVY